MKREKVIELKNVEVTYREKKSLFTYDEYTALKNITFDIYRGETLGIIGRNGAGKSTLLRVLAGIIKPDAGEISIHSSSISLMALQAGFDPNLSGRQNTIFSGMVLGHRLSYIKTIIEEIKIYSELNDFFEKPIKNYSSGMLARLGFSIAMYTTPEVLLIDEVLGVGDVTFAEKAQKSIREKIKSDTTVVIVSHDELQLKQLSDRLVCIENGVVLDEGPSDSVYNKYNLTMKLTSYGLRLIEYKNAEVINFKVGDINPAEFYSDVNFTIETNSKNDIEEVIIKSQNEHSQKVKVKDNSFWLRLNHDESYDINITDSNGSENTITLSIGF
ncbi:ABC transporter ATP-binding protein [Cedecea sp. FDAARGOS_727]|uniref:ABC transporter ATP-binding protein n=1 Tax=Cedecea sp. FDAARGOS_727 TaxID=2545798 RepID=UPI00143EB8E3|nr:ABC transporter ATP-binding protein [Cedecea sp. FDAARGOS_727]QIX97180.1 ABC transporter ATP-binding protein [Cedecea sp. FDAARGOS_727]